MEARATLPIDSVVVTQASATIRGEGVPGLLLRDEDLETSNQDIREFIEWATPAPGEAAYWGRRVPANGNR